MNPSKLTVTHPNGHYDILIGAHLIEQVDSLRHASGPLVVITDSNVGPLHAHRVPEADRVIEVPAGEQHKTLDTVNDIYNQLLDARYDRSTTIMALGGGVVGDMAGFVAATFLRGVNFIQCPTSLLAMVDASVGAKTGVDMPQGKNLIGAFKQPELVIADVTTLETLPALELACGMAELIKHGLLSNPTLLEEALDVDTGQPVMESQLPDWQRLLAAAIDVKRRVVEEDPFEHGRRATLNLGHTFGHAIERVTQFAVPHGQGVAMGLAAAVRLSARLGYCDEGLIREVESVLVHANLPVRIPAGIPPTALIEAMSSDKKRAAGKLRFILLKGVTQAFITSDVPVADVEAVLTEITEPE